MHFYGGYRGQTLANTYNKLANTYNKLSKFANNWKTKGIFKQFEPPIELDLFLLE